MDDAIRIPEPVDAKARAARLLGGIHMSPHERRQAERDLLTAEAWVDAIFAVVAVWQGFVRRLRVGRVARGAH